MKLRLVRNIQMMNFVSVGVVTLILLIIFSFVKRRLKTRAYFKDLPKPPGKSFPFLGQALLFRMSRDELFEKYSKMVFDNIVIHQLHIAHLWLGPIPIIFVFSPKIAEEILKNYKILNKTFLYSFLHSWLGTGLLTAGGEKWKTRRKLINPTFHSSILQNFLKVMNNQARIFVEKVAARAATSKKFDISKAVTLCSLDIICETAMGKSIHAQDDCNTEYVEAIYRVNEIIQERQKSPWLWPNFIFNLTRDGRDYQRMVKLLHNFTRAVLEERKAEFVAKGDKPKEKRMAFLDMLMTLNNRGDITSHGVEEEVDTFMFAGHDTTASSISWALHLIGHHPEVQQKLYEEISDVLSDDQERDLSSEDLGKLEYMELVIKESLRMFPPVPIIGRTIDTKCIIDGHEIPAGTECLILPYVINNNENFWKDPFKFDPERFKPENSKERHPFAFLSFSAGPRNCIGQRFALMEEKVVLTHYLRNYVIESCEKTENLRILGDIILRSKSGIIVKMKKRVKIV